MAAIKSSARARGEFVAHCSIGTFPDITSSCPCDQAYRPGDISGTCGGTGKLDQAVRACDKPDYNVMFVAFVRLMFACILTVSLLVSALD